MTHEDVQRLFQRIDSAFDEYEQGYADADVTIRRLDGHFDALKEQLEEE